MHFRGGCHCGKVRFAVRASERKAIECNCSICQMKGFVHLIVPQDQFEILSGEDELAEYRFGTQVALHRFCRTCGIHPFYIPRSHPDQIDVNVRCLDDDEIDRFTIEAFDGRNWEQNVDSIQDS